ncbi:MULTISPECIES: DUF4192 domain-containing protein [unclassified Actinoplanes]|uniref:DUF4192 domain-containing protein n=1 Tax=unclassified Actinoplanes TaxID=2626549 RepID=UPI0002F08119|nr:MULTISPECIES: DUF4192 domain-containing protein [unclassified Actinoplanes]
MTPDCRLAIRNPSELIAVVPFLMGYHPSDCVALVGLARDRVDFALCHDLPGPDWTDGDARAAAGSVADAVARQRARTVVVIGYGPPGRVSPAVLSTAQAVQDRGVEVLEMIRVTDGRWWSYTCADPLCCPPEGIRCLPGDSLVAAEATYHGRVALPSRRALTAQVAAVGGAEREAMAAATERARRRFTDLIADDLSADRYGRLIRQQGEAAVRAAEKRYRAGSRLDPDETAWLGVLLVNRKVEDLALDRVTGQGWQIQLWTDVLRRAEPAYVAPPACLLAFSAWRAGHGSLARVAVDRALAEEPEHQLAGLLHNVLGHGLAPHMVVLPPRGAGPWRPFRR